MSQPGLFQLVKWGISIPLIMSLLSGCGGASPTPAVISTAPVSPTSTPIPPPVPQAVLPRPTVVSSATGFPVPATTEPSPTVEGTITIEPSPTLPDPIDRPFLMRIDRISVIVGRGILLEGRVANGTLQANADVEILGPQNIVSSPTVLAILISNIQRDQVTVGDYAGILVGGIETTGLSPGILLAAAGEYESYEEALRQLQ